MIVKSKKNINYSYNFNEKFLTIFKHFRWYYESFIASKKLPLNLFIEEFWLCWDHDNDFKPWKDYFDILKKNSTFYDFLFFEGYLFDTTDQSQHQYNVYFNVLCKNRFNYKIPLISGSQNFYIRAKNIDRNFKKDKFFFIRYLKFYKSFVKIEFFLFMEKQNIIGTKTVSYPNEDFFSSFSIKRQFLIFYLKYNYNYLYKINLFNLRKDIYKNIFFNRDSYLWLPTTDFGFDLSIKDDSSIFFTYYITNNLLNIYSIYSNKKYNDYELNILNLKDYKILPEEYYNEDSYINNLDTIDIFYKFNYLNIWNKFFLLEYYSILIKLIYIN